MTILSSDVTNLSVLVMQVSAAVLIPFQLGFGLFFLARLVGMAMIPGTAIIALTALFSIRTGPWVAKHVKGYQQVEDSRIKQLRDMIMGIQVVKLRCMEQWFGRMIQKTRREQIVFLQKARMISLLITCINCLYISGE